MAVSVEISVFTLLGLWASKMKQILCSDCSQGSLLGNKVDKAYVSTVQGIFYTVNQSNHHDGKTHINGGLIIWISIQNKVLIIIMLNACNNIKNNLIIFIISNIIGEIVILKYYFWSA